MSTDRMILFQLKDKVNPLFRKVIDTYIDTFLSIASDETVSIMTTLLKVSDT